MPKQTPTTQDEARQYAIEWQHWQSYNAMSYSEVLDWETHFQAIAEQFDLVDEFTENCII